MFRWLGSVVAITSSVLALGCGDDAEGSEAQGAPSSGGTGGAPATGGAAPTGATASGGLAVTGGAATGGIPATGGTASGGATTGGAATGGVSPTGGVATGGLATGGAATGGAAAGGVATSGGTATGGVVASGGSETGGAATGGVATGGDVASGGSETGGAATGGSAGEAPSSGGAATGGAGTGGESEWPQCYSGDTLPPNPSLTVDADATGYTTAITEGGYVAMLIGPDRPSCLTDEVASRDLADLNSGLRDVVEGCGFPAFPEWSNGHYLNWVILNSGIPGATLSGEGGYQGNRWGHMNFESTQQCPCTWDEYNSGAALHESIHALQAELWKFNNEGSGWIHEGHNCYLGTMREFIAKDRYTMGYGAAGVLMASHVPIESMGLLNDDTIGGPADQGASGKSYVGGVYGVYRYGLEVFFMSLQLSMGRGFINCLWIEAPENNQQSVFKVLESYAGVEGVANAVMTFGTRNALLDYGDWTGAMRDLMQSRWEPVNNNWFYVFAAPDAEGWMTPPTKQLPHHEGRNTIPIELEPGATSVTVELEPDAAGDRGTPEHLLAQLVYRTPDDVPVYGERFERGTGTVAVPDGARNDLVSLVIAVVNPFDAGNNAQYGYDLNEHFGYRVRIVSGGTLAPTSTVPW